MDIRYVKSAGKGKFAVGYNTAVDLKFFKHRVHEFLQKNNLRYFADTSLTVSSPLAVNETKLTEKKI